MRIPIRAQLGLLVLVTSLTSLAVVAIVTWVNNYDFVVGIRSSRLSLTASLKAAQLASNLLLLQTTVSTIASRILIQNSLMRYNTNNNNTASNWERAKIDLQTALGNGESTSLPLQAVVFPRNSNGAVGSSALLNVTVDNLGNSIIFQAPNGSTVDLGDSGGGFFPQLFPNITYEPPYTGVTDNVTDNDTENDTVASQYPTAYVFNNTALTSKSTLLLGPLQLNASFALLSITVPVINNTSQIEILGYLTIVMSARTIYDVIISPEGLDKTGQVLLVAPAASSNRLPEGVGIKQGQKSGDGNVDVRFVLQPSNNVSQGIRHASRGYGKPNTPFRMSKYKAIQDAFTVNTGQVNNAGSLISTTNEEGKAVSVGYATPRTALCDWVLLVEQDKSEAFEPIRHLRSILIACVFGTTGVILFLAIPIAHYSVRPIRRLKDATEKSTRPPGYTPDGASIHSSSTGDNGLDEGMSSADEEGQFRLSKKNILKRMKNWRRSRRQSKAEVAEDARRRTFRIPGKVQDRKHIVKDELTDLTRTFNEMTEELVLQYERLEERVKERTTELELSKKAAEAANESKTLFIANISHELKTPLNGILGMCAVCMQEEDTTKIKRSLGIIYKSGDLLLNLLNDLLTFSKNQIGHQLSLNETEFRLADIKSQISTIFEKQARDGNIDFRIVFEGPTDIVGVTIPGSFGDVGYDPPDEVGLGPPGTGKVKDMSLWGDQNRILQVIINLVSNSLKFTPPGGSVRVRIRCIGEEELAPEGRQEGSLMSRQNSSRHSRVGSRQIGPNTSTGSIAPVRPASDTQLNSTVAVNVVDQKIYPPHVYSDASPSPPLDTRTLIFEFEVQDTGPGIPEHLHQRVFEPFVQGDLGLSKKYGGTGLGLSICSQLAKLMKGSVALHSSVGFGSTFCMRIPLKFVKERAESVTESLQSQHNSIAMTTMPDDIQAGSLGRSERSRSDTSVRSSQANGTTMTFDQASKPRLVGLSQPFFTTSPSPSKDPVTALELSNGSNTSATTGVEKIRVLVAEDNKVNQEVVLRMLKLEDIYDVTLAKDGQEALDKVKESMQQQKLFNLIFMDIQMPNLDGLQSTRLIREMGFSAPIVALTAFAEESNVKECMESGMNYFLAKPIRRPALKQVLRTYCSTIPEETESNPTDKEANSEPTTPA